MIILQVTLNIEAELKIVKWYDRTGVDLELRAAHNTKALNTKEIESLLFQMKDAVDEFSWVTFNPGQINEGYEYLHLDISLTNARNLHLKGITPNLFSVLPEEKVRWAYKDPNTLLSPGE